MNNEVCELCQGCNGNEVCIVAYHRYCDKCGNGFMVEQKDTKIDRKTKYTPNHNWDMLYANCPICGEKVLVAFIPNEDDDIEKIIAHNDMIPKTVRRNK